MKHSICIGLAIFTIALCSGCAKKQTASENNPTDAEITAQNQDFSNRKPFQFTITTDRETDKENIEITVSINKLDGKYPVLYDLDCESDGDYEFTGLTDDQKCVFEKNTGKHQISVRGNIPGMFLCARHLDDKNDCDTGENNDVDFRCKLTSNEDDSGKNVISIDSWGDISWKSMFAFAADCERLEVIPAEAPDLSQVSDMSLMFEKASSFNQPLERWDVSNVTDMSEMFSLAKSFNQPLEKWNVSKVTDMSEMFAYAESFNQPLERWDVSDVTDMSEMFYDAESFNQPLEKWDVSHVTNMSKMFYSASSFNQPLEKWNVSKVTDMSEMFAYAESFNQPLELWNVSKVTNMSRMFMFAYSFNQPLEKWNVSNVRNMSNMFYDLLDYNHPLERWDVSNVTDMSGMFEIDSMRFQCDGNKKDCDYIIKQRVGYNQPLEKWNVSNVKDMSNMFSGNTNFNQPLEKWDVSNVKNMSGMFDHAYSFNQSLDKWDVSNVCEMEGMFEGAFSLSYYPKSWVVPEDHSDNMFEGTKVEDIAKKKPLKTEKRSERCSDFDDYDGNDNE